RKILVPVPTFSPYLEFVPKGVKIILHRLEKRKDFRLDIHTLLAQVKKEKPDTVVIINPNNPDGGFVSARNVRLFLTQLKRIQTVILDESFIHFANTSTRVLQGSARLVREFPNLAVIKSLSKDFGIAGLRLSYGVMSEKRVSSLLENGYLWNVSGFGEYFLNLLNNRGFMEEYEKARLLAIRERDVFFMQLSTLKDIKVYPSSANLFLVELLDGSTANNLTVRLLARYGIYIRSCGDKVGLRGEFFRIASRKRAENNALIAALTDIFSQ
ncbi:MAG TPA: aminotransferase, partial [Candidatus Taylorbacteria bacterium]|nr:aminotransferase [Candidatus Taylorbacteria bacterium]